MLLINLIGYHEGNMTGYGVATRYFWKAMEKLSWDGCKFLLTDLRHPAQVESNIFSCRQFTGKIINIWLQVGPGVETLARFPGEKIAYTMFETDTLPMGWVEGLNQADRVFTPSTWGRQIMIDCGVDFSKIQVIPLGVDGSIYNPWGGKLAQLNTPTFKFLMVGRYESRKGYNELFSAFAKAFSQRMDVELLVKANSFIDSVSTQQIRALAHQFGLTNVRFIEGAVDEPTMAALYRSCDCFVFPSKGEGWGLPLIEAMACGLPVISTYCSGHSEYLSKFRGRFQEIDAAYKEVDTKDFDRFYRFESDPGKWYIPFPDSIASAMQKLVEKKMIINTEELAMDVIKYYSWEQAAHTMMWYLKNAY